MQLINKYRMHNLTIHTFMQSCFPRIVKDTLRPLPQGPFSPANEDEWYPPGKVDGGRKEAARAASGVVHGSMLDE